MNDLIPVEKVIEENPCVEELEKQGYMINPKKIDRYLELMNLLLKI